MTTDTTRYEITYSSCTPHPGESCQPACTGGGHCVANISYSKRPTRLDMVEWLNSKSSFERNHLLS